MSTNIASYVGEEQVWTYVKGYGQSPATPAELDDDEAAGRAGDGGRRDGPVHGAAAAALEPRDDGQPDRAGEGRRSSTAASIRRTSATKARACSAPIDEAIQVGKGASIPRRHHPHEDRAQEALGPRQRDHRDGAEGARRGLRHPRERLSLHRRAEQPVVDRAAVGARRRPREDARAAQGSGGAASGCARK